MLDVFCCDRKEKKYIYIYKNNRDDSGIALTIILKEAVGEKMRFRITSFSQDEFWYLLSNRGYIMSYKNYNISKSDSYQKINKIYRK